MYIKRILILIAGIGLVFMGSFSFYVYKVMFKSNTSFENDYVHIYIKTGTTIDQFLNHQDLYYLGLIRHHQEHDTSQKRHLTFQWPISHLHFQQHK